METKIIKKKIKREKPNKKWTLEEVNTILNYLMDSQEIEKPTAQIFYKKLIEKTGINATWELIRWKVRHLKSTYKDASDWRSSTGAGLLEIDAGANSVEGKVLQICPHYHKLHQIFGAKCTQNAYEVIDSGEINEADVEVSESIDSDCIIYECIQETGEEAEICVAAEPVAGTSCGQSSQAVIPKKARDFAEKLKKNSPKTPAAHLAAFQAERTAMFKMKIEWEKERQDKEIEIHERETKLKEDQLKAEIEFKNREMDLKAHQIEEELKMKKLELEKDERIKMFEIEMKYKHASTQ
ncbi:PREDICTED: uncharacterized protein LOC108381846 [Rhagoletis zephyria]|uniref:uncharacterized protein LOC108381846 n=1 Tax=Rhagoletis zephyria TaxID=28612 RepID=UPI0008114173|nr:PREDICTED: uncharacterized protein LOC108381846 [Rhagoletis zephyria]